MQFGRLYSQNTCGMHFRFDLVFSLLGILLLFAFTSKLGKQAFSQGYIYFRLTDMTTHDLWGYAYNSGTLNRDNLP